MDYGLLILQDIRSLFHDQYWNILFWVISVAALGIVHFFRPPHMDFATWITPVTYLFVITAFTLAFVLLPFTFGPNSNFTVLNAAPILVATIFLVFTRMLKISKIETRSEEKKNGKKQEAG